MSDKTHGQINYEISYLGRTLDCEWAQMSTETITRYEAGASAVRQPLIDKIAELEATLDDEEAGHQETLSLLKRRDDRIAELEREVKTLRAYFPSRRSLGDSPCTHPKKYTVIDQANGNYFYCDGCQQIVL